MLRTIILGLTLIIIIIIVWVKHCKKKKEFDPAKFIYAAFSCIYMPIGIIFLSYAVIQYPKIILSEFRVEMFFAAIAFISLGADQIKKYCSN